MRLLLIFALTLGTSLLAHAETILIVGDSISCGPYGANLIQGLTRQGHQVTMYCSVSSSPKDWLAGKNVSKRPSKNDPLPYFKCSKRTSASVGLAKCDGSDRMPTFEQILARNPSDRVMVALGTNSLPAARHTPGVADATYTRMLSMIAGAGRDCTWIGPPHLQPAKVPSNTGILAREEALDSFYTSLKTRTADGKCALVDSRPATASGRGNQTGDGIHPTADAALARYERQADAIHDAIAGAGKGRSSDGKSKAHGIR
jgi:lysophospholipase L1-like esterase